MAYTFGTFYINFSSGSDAARTALTSCTASNPSGSITRINKTAHGLVTGAVVDLTLFTAWLNDAWKITVVDADNFDLDAATWQTTADASGTVTPRGGMNWTDAWLTTTSGATAARIQPGDTLRIAKTADPVSLGQNATWTDNSQTVTLTTAVTKKIEDGITGWTGATNVTANTNAARKIGATSASFTIATNFTTGKIAYKIIDGGGTQDFSAYQKINLWFQNATASTLADSALKICLCSDATGDTIVDTLNFPATIATTGWNCLVLDKGSALGSNIQSVAIYANVDPGAITIRINNIFAANSDLSLKTLIGKTGDVNYNIQSIDGTNIKIDSNNTAATGRGYSGATSTETLYYQVPFDVATTTNFATLNEAGNKETGLNTCTGGWNTSSNTRDGHTVLGSTVVGVGSPFSIPAAWRVENFKMARFSSIGSQNANVFEVNNCVWCGGGGAFAALTTVSDYKFSSSLFLNSSTSAVSIGCADNRFLSCEFRNNASSGVSATGSITFMSSTFANNGAGSISPQSSGVLGTASILLRNCTLSDSTEVGNTTGSHPVVYSFDHDNTQGNHWAFHNGGTVNWQTATVHASEPGAWRTVTTSAIRNSYNPIPIKIAEVACAASALVTVKAWVKKDHATNIGAAIYVEDAAYNIAGVTAAETTKASDTSWEELTLTFTPTEAGVVPIFTKTWYIAGNSNSYIGSVTITQA
jgi:hypothetical protein